MSSVEKKDKIDADISTKPKVTKSRNGCLTCKKKRLKCDETKPACINCTRKKITCGGYATKFKWRLFNDGVQVDNDSNLMKVSKESRNEKRTLSVDSSEVVIEREKKQKTEQDKIIRKHIELASLSVTGKSIKDINRESEMINKGLNPSSNNNRRPSQQSMSSISQGHKIEGGGRRSQSFSNDSDFMPSPAGFNSPSMHRSYSTNSSSRYEINSFRNEFSKIGTNGLDSLAEAVIDEINGRSPISSIPDQFLTSGGPSPGNTQVSFSPNMSDLLNSRKFTLPRASPKPLENTDLAPLTRKDYQFGDVNLNTPSLSALINYAFTNEDDKLLESDIKLNLDFPLSPLNLSHSHNDISSGKDDSLEKNRSIHVSNDISGLEGNKISLYDPNKSPIIKMIELASRSNQLLMKSAESEQILFLYSEYTCTIMSIKNGPNENPWRKLIIPSALNYPCLYNSIASMTLFHLAGFSEMKSNSQNLRARGYMHMKKCILELASGLSKVDITKNDPCGLPCDIALATCLNLAMSETWDTHTSSGIAHLKGAKSLIQKVLHFLKEEQETITHKRQEFMKNPRIEIEYKEMIDEKRKLFKNKLALLSNHEWEKMLADSEVEHNIDELIRRNKKSTIKENKIINKSNISIPTSLQFFFNHWIYFEVLSQITTDSDDKGIDLVATITSISESAKRRKNDKENLSHHSENSDLTNVTSPTRSESTDSSNYIGDPSNGFTFFGDFDPFVNDSETVDPLLGCGQALFMIMGKVANLISKIRKVKAREIEKGIRKNTNRLSFITTATQLRQQLIEWKPTITPAMLQAGSKDICDFPGANSTWDIASCIATGEAYRYATLLYLHQAVPEIPSLTSHQLAEKVFILLASIPVKSHTYVLHIFPLLISSCEAELSEERSWCETRWLLLSEKMWIGNIDRSLEVVKEVWRRKDEYKRKKRHSKLDEMSTHDLRINCTDDEHLRNISSQMSGLMAVVNNDQNESPMDDLHGGITSNLHWSTVMKEWGWEVLLG